MLRNLPKNLESDYILREKFNNTICEQLRQIDQFGGHILVYGMPGCGKSVAVCQAVRQLIVKENYFKSDGCHWIKIGISLNNHILSSYYLTVKCYVYNISEYNICCYVFIKV